MTIPTIEVVAGVIWQNVSLENSKPSKKFLASLRLPYMPMGGFWEFPGGKIENTESPENALYRELLEELGITIKQWSFWKSVAHAYPTRHVILHFFHVTAFDGQAQGIEGQEIRWITPQEAQHLPFLEADIPLVEELLNKQIELNTDFFATFQKSI